MKRPYLLLLLGLLLSVQSFAAGINFVENKTWKEILAMAKKQNKLVFLDAYATWCGPCKYMQKNVFTDNEVGKYYNANFINVKIDMEAGEGVELSEQLGVTSYPTLFFINGNGEVVHKTLGAMEAEDFVVLGKAALDPEKQYYTVKAKAALGKMSPAAFHDWVHEAEGMEDEDMDEVISKYLAATKHPLVEKEMLSLVMDHGTGLTRLQLDQIYANRAKCTEILEVEPAQFDEALLQLVLNYAHNKAGATSPKDFAVFKQSIQGYFPEVAALQTQIAKVGYYVAAENTKALDELSILMQNYGSKLSAEDMALVIIDATNMIADAGKGKEFITKVLAYKVREEEAEKSYYKDLALMMLYYRMEDKERWEHYGNKILKNKNTPEQISNMVSSFMEE